MFETILSQEVQNSFTNSAEKWGILSLSIREAASPTSTQPTDLISLLPPLFCEMTENTLFPFPLGCRVFSCLRSGQEAYTNLSNTVQNSFTHFRSECGILTLSIGKPQSRTDSHLQSFISLLPPLFCEMIESTPIPFPHGSGCFPACRKRFPGVRLHC